MAKSPPFTINSPIALPNGLVTTLAAVIAARPSQSVAQRAPTALDDLTAGYSVGNLWLCSGTVYQALQVSAGQAVWMPVAAARGLPCDVVVTPAACYGSRALNVAWLNGNWIDVAAAAGGTPTTIKFINGEPDLATLAKVTGGGLGYVSRWYDQSGAGLDAVQTTAANQPVVRADILTGGAPSIVFDSVINPTLTTVEKYLTLPSGLTVTGNADSVFFVGRSYTNRRTAGFVQLSHASFPQTFSFGAGPFSTGINASYWYGSPYSVSPPSMSEAVAGWTSGASGQAVYWGNNAAAFAAQGPNTMASGFIGRAVNSSGTVVANGQSEISSLIVYGRGLSAIEAINLRASLVRLFPHFPQVQDVNVADGDSITEGFKGIALQNRPRKELNLFADATREFVTAFWGSTSTQRLADYPTYVAPLYNAKAKNNILSTSMGTNDLVANNATAAATYANLTQYLALAHATGFRVVCATVLPRGDANASQTSAIAAYNALVRANSGGAYGTAGQWDAIADIAADPTMGAASAPSNSTLYADGIHPTDLGYSYLAPIYLKARSGLLR